MLNLRYDLSPLLDQGGSAAGKRLPDPLLRTPGAEPGARGIRLHDLMPDGPALLAIGKTAGSWSAPIGTSHGPGRTPTGSRRQ
ncbi:hypothetical protein BH23GEM11_BH23GEM11_00030 [soil metagenome]